MPPKGKNLPGALAGSTLARNRLIRKRSRKSAGFLRDQQTLGQITVSHGHLLLWG